MIALQAIAWSCLAFSPLAVSAGACKPKSTDLSTTIAATSETASSAESTVTDITTTIASTIDTTASSILEETTETSTIETTTSEAASTTSSAPCPSYTQIIPPPSGKVCGKEVTRGDSSSSPLYLASPLSVTGLTGCAKYCGDNPECVSFYAEDYSPAPGAPVYKICFLFKGYEKDIPFGPGEAGKPTYYEQDCFACVRDEAQPPIPS
ncbi:hypothetical protein FBEOM_3234 [Fusarium beomiforme]|uniref:Apple domain-containing protein n=1 Tax=Fusarium beomiforme TaxID=44412 RepID=A0A9P5AQ15_9HYPO|nr:hypothetical protein FBEOM_3234 [Fusarium beomiforme]